MVRRLASPERDFPALVDLYQQGRLLLDKFASERIKLDQVEDAFATMHRGEVLRSVARACSASSVWSPSNVTAGHLHSQPQRSCDRCPTAW